ncbi:MurR/RpiR family transcriptional regulator [Megamonas hypermegale]|uniref:MurR/RpiR family transcriptional regulator n=1 Tax=Megamonas hypermegale TaxID=158847 RepID=UPI0026E9A038|nr:MurR/RpiR family transcriptional regulator [Megamonas hypermegale]
MDNLVKILQEQKNFSESESIIATYLLTNFRKLAGMSTRELARNAYTNSAAIVRFSQKLGFTGYTEFKVQFLAEMMQYINHPENGELLVSTHDSIHALIEKVTAIEVDTLKYTRSILNPEDFLKALPLFSKSEHIDFYAMDNNLDIARIAAAGFIMANKCSSVNSSMTMQYLQATGGGKTHLGFFISRTGSNRMLLDIARLLKMKHTPIISITSNEHSELASLSDVTFTVATVKNMEELGPRVFLLGAKYVTDILFAMLMTRLNYNEAQQKEQWLSKNFRY